jgi:hypothetical protein
MALFGRDRRVGECLLLREERKSGLRDPNRTSGHFFSEAPNHYSTAELARYDAPTLVQGTRGDGTGLP